MELNNNFLGLKQGFQVIDDDDSGLLKRWKTFEQLRKIDDVYVKILTVVHDGNAKEIIPLMKEVKKKGPDNHSVILVRGETIDDNIHLPPVSELRELGREIFAIQESYDHRNNPLVAHLLKNYHRYVWNISLKTIEKERQIVPFFATKPYKPRM